MNTLYTLGYTGLKPAQILAVALKLDAIVVDIRMSPVSRVPHWNGPALAQLLGTRYVHTPAFGNVNYKNGGSIKLHSPNIGLQQIAPLLKRQPLILLCACPDPQTCHRRIAAEVIAAECGCEVVHLTAKDLTEAPKDEKPQQRELF